LNKRLNILTFLPEFEETFLIEFEEANPTLLMAI
jgi:hypothetical protein